jgi:hypothetical protein
MYNLRPYGSRGWPTFEKTAASIVLAHITQHKRRGGAKSHLFSLFGVRRDLPPPVAQAEASTPKFINIDVIGAPREVVVAQSPERLLRECKKNLRSERIFFTGNADRKEVVQLLFDFEYSIAVEFDPKRAEHLKLRTEDLEHAFTAELGDARKKRYRNMLQRLTFHEAPTRILHVSVPTPTESHWVDPQKLPAPKPTVATEAPNPESTNEQRHATSSSVFVKWSNGAETLAYVKEYDVEKALYTVELERLSSGKVKTCEGKHLREANTFQVMFFNVFSPPRVDFDLYDT